MFMVDTQMSQRDDQIRLDDITYFIVIKNLANSKQFVDILHKESSWMK